MTDLNCTINLSINQLIIIPPNIIDIKRNQIRGGGPFPCQQVTSAGSARLKTMIRMTKLAGKVFEIPIFQPHPNGPKFILLGGQSCLTSESAKAYKYNVQFGSVAILRE